MRCLLVLLFVGVCSGQVERSSDAAPAVESTPRERNVSGTPCGRTLFTGRTGFLTSHAEFERRLYPRSMECSWRIMVAPSSRLLLFPSSMSLESEADCEFDGVEVFDGWSPTARSLGRLCGADVNAMFVSSGHRMRVVFRSDSSISKKGFSMRYVPVANNSEPHGPARLQRRRDCTSDERKCANGLCVPTALWCDRFDDCGDQSDERVCVDAPQSLCGPAKFQCNNGRCLGYHQRCDGLFDCEGREDEEACGPDGVLTPSNDSDIFDPSVQERIQCGVSLVAPRQEQGRIVGGQVARRATWPWTVSLRNNGGHVCGGSIISSRWILTAAHCVEGAEDPNQWSIAAGLLRTYESGRRVQVRRVSRVVVHPNWEPRTIDYDLTLMRLSRRLRWTKYVRPICVADRAVGSARCYIAGWGDTKGTGGAGRLKQGYIRTFSNRQCSRWYGGGITRRMVCAGRREGGVDSCQGDSGGPLMCQSGGRFLLHGATSFGGECGAPNSPGVYARVTSMRDWIRRISGV